MNAGYMLGLSVWGVVVVLGLASIGRAILRRSWPAATPRRAHVLSYLATAPLSWALLSWLAADNAFDPWLGAAATAPAIVAATVAAGRVGA